MATVCQKGLMQACIAHREAIDEDTPLHTPQTPGDSDEQAMAAAIEAYLRHRQDRCPSLLVDVAESYASFKATWLSVSDGNFSFYLAMGVILLSATAVLSVLIALALRLIVAVLGL